MRAPLPIVVCLLGFAGVSSSNLGCGSSGGTTDASGTAGGGGSGGAAGGSGGRGAAGAAGGQAGGASGAGGVGASAGAGGVAGNGAAGSGGAAAGSGGGAAGSGGGAAGSGGGAAGAGGGAAGSGGAGGATCSEPAPCEGYDNSPDANLKAAITCLSPDSAASNAGFTLAIFGHHLATGATNYAIVTIGGGVALNGVPASACHLDVTVPASAIASPGQFPVVVSPGGRVQDSTAAALTVR
jgi:hypothetical protein